MKRAKHECCDCGKEHHGRTVRCGPCTKKINADLRASLKARPVIKCPTCGKAHTEQMPNGEWATEDQDCYGCVTKRLEAQMEEKGLVEGATASVIATGEVVKIKYAYARAGIMCEWRDSLKVGWLTMNDLEVNAPS